MPTYKPEAVPKDKFVDAMRRSGSRTMTMETLEADIAAGAPVNDDGTINVFAYAAWILKEDSDAD